MVENQQTSEFYPTPESLVEKMIQRAELDYCKTILDPSAGKGDILRGRRSKHCRHWFVCMREELRNILNFHVVVRLHRQYDVRIVMVRQFR